MQIIQKLKAFREHLPLLDDEKVEELSALCQSMEDREVDGPLKSAALKELWKEMTCEMASKSDLSVAIRRGFSGYGLFLSAVQLAWYAYIGMQGLNELTTLQGLLIGYAILVVVTNFYYSATGLVDASCNIPLLLHRVRTGERVTPLEERYYRALAVGLKIMALMACALSFGPTTSVSMELPRGWNVASALFLSQGGCLLPIRPLMSAIENGMTEIGMRSSDEKVRNLFRLDKKIRELVFALSCAAPEAVSKLAETLEGSEALEDIS